MRLSRKALVLVAFLALGPRLLFLSWKLAKEQALPQGPVQFNGQPSRLALWTSGLWQRAWRGGLPTPPTNLGNATGTRAPSKGGRSHRNRSGARAKGEARGAPSTPASLRVLDYVRCNVSTCGGLFAHQRQFVVFNASLRHPVLRRWLRVPVGGPIWEQQGAAMITSSAGRTPSAAAVMTPSGGNVGEPTGGDVDKPSPSGSHSLYGEANLSGSLPLAAASIGVDDLSTEGTGAGIGNVTAGGGERKQTRRGHARRGTHWRYFHFPKPLFELLPLDEPRWHPRNCAVVGNSGAVLLQTAGLEIDAHDVVIRLNLAPVYGFQPYVGQKTTFDFVNANNVRQLLQGQLEWARSPAEGVPRLVMFDTTNESTRVHLCRKLLEDGSSTRPLLLNPVFVAYVQAIWMELFRLLERRSFSSFNAKPMSGFFAIMAALQMCDTVHVYGFDAYSSKKISYRYHYFDDVKGFTDVHSFDMAFEIFKLMESRGLVVMQHY